MAARWQSRDVAIALPQSTLRAMWERARRSFSIDQGGRYDARSATTILLWSGPLTSPGAHPVGSFTVRWDTPRSGTATIKQVAWTSRESHVWRAIEVLAGDAWPRESVRPGAEPLAA